MKSNSKEQFFRGAVWAVMVIVLLVVLPVLWRHWAGPDHPFSDPSDRPPPTKEMTLHDWLLPPLFGFAAFLFASLVLFFHDDYFLRGQWNDFSTLGREERDRYPRMHRLAARKTAVSAGMVVVLVAFVLHGNYFGAGLWLLVNLLLSFLGWEYWE